MPPVARVIPDYGHTYFIRGHNPKPSLITNLCSGCTSERAFNKAKQDFQHTKWTKEYVEIRG